MVIGWKILATNEVVREGVTIVGQVAQEAANHEQVVLARYSAQSGSRPGASGRGQRRMLLSEGAEPAQQMLPAQLGEFAQMGKGSVKISEKAADTGAILFHSIWPEGGGQDLNPDFKDFVEGRLRWLHNIFSGKENRTRWATARAYSRQTSCGAICT